MTFTFILSSSFALCPSPFLLVISLTCEHSTQFGIIAPHRRVIDMVIDMVKCMGLDRCHTTMTSLT